MTRFKAYSYNTLLCVAALALLWFFAATMRLAAHHLTEVTARVVAENAIPYVITNNDTGEVYRTFKITHHVDNIEFNDIDHNNRLVMIHGRWTLTKEALPSK